MSQILSDAAGIAVIGLSGIKDTIDATFSASEAQVPKLESDAIDFATEYIDNHIGGTAGGFVKVALGLAGPIIKGAEPLLTKAILAALAVAQTRVDNDLASIQTKLPTA